MDILFKKFHSMFVVFTYYRKGMQYYTCSTVTKLALLFTLLHSVASSQTVDSFFVAGIHPAATLQSTAIGRKISTLFPWNGKLYSGYGDYGANTGPIDIYSFSPDSIVFTFEAEANTEAIYNYRVLNGMLYAPAIDRKSYAIPGDYIKMDSSGIWANYDFGSNSTHTFDAARMNDTIVFMMGSQNNNAIVWKSNNNGQTWSKILTDTAISGVPGDFARFYFGGVLNGNLYVQARDYYGPMHPNSKIYDGVSWTTGPSLFPTFYSLGWRPQEFSGKLVYTSWEPGGSSPLRSFDGTNIEWLDSLWVYDCFIDSGYFYALVDSGWGSKNLRRTLDLINWENLLTVPDSSQSLAILNDILFIGTADSKILQYSKPVSQLATSIQVLNPDKYSMTIYPNPAFQIVNISFSLNSNFEVEILNTKGEVVLVSHNRKSIDVSMLQKGFYLLNVNQGRSIIIQKFIKL